ncbi:MAG: molybdate ABC transporter substrate-binding protein [Verrucomicrobia bacterium 61-8]|nr:molybdate ABC transporter substrate-binding protein [Verrucomicrobiota bacterium]OJV24070.1 MAG: molybdate ABC transporter substrate-binding protein [Verrucomicrobia bacterium 61-8]
MKRPFARLLLGTALALLAALSPLPAQTIVVSAAASLKDALADVNTAFAAKHPGMAVDLNLAGSGALQQQIEQGAPVDVFISAATKQMDALSAKGLLMDGTVFHLLGNKVVLVGPPGATKPASFEALTDTTVKRIAIGEPGSVPAGQYAQQIFAYYKIADALKPRLIFAKDVRMVLTYAETGNVDAGVVYMTDAMQSGKVAILAEAPAGSHDPVIYPAAIIKAARQPEAARTYLAFLKSPDAAELFSKRGFEILVKP